MARFRFPIFGFQIPRSFDVPDPKSKPSAKKGFVINFLTFHFQLDSSKSVYIYIFRL